LGHLRRGDEAEAERRFRAAIELDDRNIEAQYNLGLLLITGERGRAALEEGLEHCRAALAINPSLAPAQVNAANALRQLGRPAEAEAEARAALVLQPGMIAARRNLAEALFEQERFAEAAVEFGAIAAALPGESEIRSPWIVSLLRAGDLAGARREAERARAEFRDPWFDFCLARVEARAGNADAALALLHAAASAPEFPDWMAKVEDFEPYRAQPGFAELLAAP
jgi:tetratricopeptide (TPR) repeat protein